MVTSAILTDSWKTIATKLNQKYIHAMNMAKRVSKVPYGDLRWVSPFVV